MFNIYKNIPNYIKIYLNYKNQNESDMFNVHVQFTTIHFKPLPHQKS